MLNNNANKGLQLIALLAVALTLGYFVSTAKWMVLASALGMALLISGGFLNRWYGIVMLLTVAPVYGFLRYVIGLSNQQIIIKEALVVLITASSLAVKIVLEKRTLKWYEFDKFLSIFLFMAFIQFLRSPDPIMGLLGIRILATYIPLYYVVRYERPSNAQIKTAILIVFIVLCLTTVYGLWQSAIGLTRLEEMGLAKVATSMGVATKNNEMIRIFSTFAGPEYFGATLIFAVLLLISLWVTLDKVFVKILFMAAIAMMIMAVGLTLVRLEWAMLAVGILVLGVATRNYRVIIGVMVLGLIAITFAPEAVVERAKMSFGREDESYTARKEVYLEWNIVNIGENIVGTGIGTTNGASVYAKLSKRNVVSNLIGGGNTESWYTAIAIEMGIIGLIVYLGLWILIIRHSFQIYMTSLNKYIKGLALGYMSFACSMAIFNVVAPMPACFPAGDLYFWVLLGIITVMYEREQEELLLEQS